VHDVVGERANAWPADVPQHREVGCEREQEEQEPAVVGVEVQHEGRDEDREALEAQQPTGEVRHRSPFFVAR